MGRVAIVDWRDQGASVERTPYVFVYGTLKRGHGNHRYFLLDAGSRDCGDATVDGLSLFDIGASFPAAFWREGGHVEGEVYEVSPGVLRALDGLEGVPHLYQRRLVTTRDGRDVWTYVIDEGRLWRAEERGPVWPWHVDAGQATR